jgi:hypothetical protein
LGQHVQTTVDHPLAAYYFNKLVKEFYYEEKIEMKLLKVFATIPKDSALDKNIAYLARHISIDFATLYYIHQTYSILKNRRAQDLFQSYLNNLENSVPIILFISMLVNIEVITF